MFNDSFRLTRLVATVIIGGSFLISSGCGRSGRPGYDKGRYDKLEAAILRSTNMLAGVSFADASRLLALEGVRWDEGYSNAPLEQQRIYHFHGFSLRLDLEVRPPGITPGIKKAFRYDEQQLRSNGVWWVARSWPQLEIDRLDDPPTRMSNYWDNTQASFRHREAEQRSIAAILRRQAKK